MNKITVYGFGYVGKAIVKFLQGAYQVQVVDPVVTSWPSDQEPELAAVKAIPSWKEAEATKHAVICVPTPMREDRTCDTSIVEDIIRNSPHEFFLIKSAVIPGTVERLIAETGKKICVSPEYIGEGKYVVHWWKGHPHPTDMRYHNFQIFGGAREVTKEFVEIFKKILGPNCTYAQTDARTAALCKYMENSWGAMKVTFANEWSRIAKAFGVDYNELRELWALDARVEKMHTMVFEDAPGFGGKCFPKDVNAITEASAAAGYEPELMREVIRSNKRFRGEA